MYTIPIPENKINQRTRSRIGEAIYLLAHLIRSANWETGTFCTTHTKIARETGFPVSSIKRWLQTLVKAGEITTMRVRHGTLITIRDYQSVAKTRRVNYHPRKDNRPEAPSAAPPGEPTVPPADLFGPPASQLQTATDPSFRPPADSFRTAGGPTNINKILYQVRIQSTSPNMDSHSPENTEAADGVRRNQTGAARTDLFDYSTPWERALAAARARLEQLTESQRQAIIQSAMEEMEADPRPFVRVFVTRDPSGRLIPRGKLADEMILTKVAEMTNRADPEPAPEDS